MTSERLGAQANALSWISGNLPNQKEKEEFRSVPLAEVHEHDYLRLRAPPYPRVAALAEDMASRGQTTPLFVRPRAEGGYDLIAGYRRRSALEQAGVLTAIVRVFEGLSDDDALDLAVSENSDREDVSDWERAELAQRLQSKGRTYEGIAASLHLSEVQVKRLLRVAKNATPPLQEALHNRRVTLALVTKFLELQLDQLSESEQTEILNEAMEQDCSVREFVRLVARREKKAPARPVDRAFLRTMKNGAVTVSLKLEPGDTEALDERITALQQALKLARKLRKQAEEAVEPEPDSSP